MAPERRAILSGLRDDADTMTQHSTAELRVLRAIVASLVAAGVLPACAGGAATSGGWVGATSDAPEDAPPDLRPAPPTASGELGVCNVTFVNRVQALICNSVTGDKPISTERPCATNAECARGERCVEGVGKDAAGAPISVCYRQLSMERGPCSMNHDCLSDLRCVVAAGDTRGTCERACASGCAEGTVCVPTMSDVTTVPGEIGAAPVREPGPFKCLPSTARTYSRGSEDACRDPGETCRVDDATWVCDVARHTDGFRCGRPLLVDAAPRTAMPDDPPRTAPLVERVREIAYDEHASIVAFSRTLTMLAALGAPLALLRSTSAALGDEIVHAELAFALLDELDPERRGERPGVFPAALAALPPLDQLRDDLLVDTVRGGCVGETASAIDAERMAAREDVQRRPSALAFFRRIAVDESRHAALAYETLSWLAGVDRRRWALADRTFAEIEAASDAPAIARPLAARVEARATASTTAQRWTRSTSTSRSFVTS